MDRLRCGAVLVACAFACTIACVAREVRVLTLDGGGIRGVLSLEVLRRLEKDAKVDLTEDFDLYAGTSTGAIIAVGIASGTSVDVLENAYKNLGSKVFGTEQGWSLFQSGYSGEVLEEACEEYLKICGLHADARLGDLPGKVVIVAVDLKDEKTKRPRMSFFENVTPAGGEVKVLDALIRSTAAPTYFPASEGYVDGGLGMRDPALAGLIFASTPRQDLREVRLLSIGTGYSPEEAIEGSPDWGTVQWLLTGGYHSEASPLVELLFDLPDTVSSQVTRGLLGDRYRRVDLPLLAEIELDDYEKIDSLITYTRMLLDREGDQWKKTISWVREHITGKETRPSASDRES
ncbi:MAG: patatin-like phospholipase family protein [Simkaniaceae bacterium]|nr:patatin-like phospholipase family protein [Simkaniaceae bacterium]